MATILVADDNPVNRELLVKLLSYVNHRVLEAGDGEEAVELARAERPDLLIADIVMPRMDGFELVRSLRTDEITRFLPVIFYTATYMRDEALVLAAECSVRHVLTKPCDPEVILKAVSEALGSPTGPIRDPAPGFHERHLQTVSDKLVEKVVALERAEEELRSILERVPDVLLTARLDPDGSWPVTRITPMCAELYGAAPDEFLEDSLLWQSFIHADDREAVLGERQTRLRAGERCLQTYRIRARSGEVRWVENLSLPVLDSEGRVIGLQAIVRDVTVRALQDNALRESHRQLEALIGDLQAAQDRVIEQERLRALGQMAGGIAHDFNNALAPILGFSDLLLDRPQLVDDREKVLSFLRLINTSALDAASVVRRLREFYRPRDREEVFQEVNLNAIISQAVELTRPRWRDQAQARGANIAVELPKGDVPGAAGDEGHLREALTNLIFNAVDAMPEGGTLTFRTALAEAGDRVLLEVSDTGTGMTEEARRRCLEPFFSTKGEDGTGLGLSMVYGIVQRHEGTLEIRSAPGEGTTFSIALPVYTEPGFPPPLLAQPEPQPALRVLIVDDEEGVRDVVEALLAADGHSVASFGRPVEGLRALSAERFDLIVTDRAMPEMNGDQFALAARRLAPNTPVILLTGFGDLMHARSEHPPGVDAVVGKPVSVRSLREAVRAVREKGGVRN